MVMVVVEIIREDGRIEQSLSCENDYLPSAEIEFLGDSIVGEPASVRRTNP